MPSRKTGQVVPATEVTANGLPGLYPHSTTNQQPNVEPQGAILQVDKYDKRSG